MKAQHFEGPPECPTFPDAKVRRLARRLDRGEITEMEFAQVLVEHQVHPLRLRLIFDEQARRENGWVRPYCITLIAAQVLTLLLLILAVALRAMR